jgi:sulfur-oxidizing protein SoxZ
MAEIGQVRIRVPSRFTAGEVIKVRSLIVHPMEIVRRDKDGKVIEKNYNFIHTVIVAFNGKEILRGETTQAVSENPFFAFPLKVTGPGTLTITFMDTTGKKYEGSAEIKL